jgi:hypothetical protein
MFKNKVLLISGGTGSFGGAVLKYFDVGMSHYACVDSANRMLVEFPVVAKDENLFKNEFLRKIMAKNKFVEDGLRKIVRKFRERNINL